MSVLRIYLFGVGRIEHPAVRGEEVLSPCVKALLGYLLLHEGRAHRDVLAAMFWPDADGARARNRLSSVLWRLRRVLEPAGVRSGTYLSAPRADGVAFKANSPHWLDVAEFEAAARDLFGPADLQVRAVERFESAVAVFRPELLAGVDQPWLLIERERLASVFFRASVRALAWYERAGDPEKAIVVAQGILDHDPLREEVHRTLIRLYGGLGRRAAARRQFDRCRTVLADELGVPPLAETVLAAAAAVGDPRRAEGAASADRADGARRTASDVVPASAAVDAPPAATIAQLERVARDLDIASRELARIVQRLVDLSERAVQ